MPSLTIRIILSTCLVIPVLAMAHEPPAGLLAHLPMDGDLSDRSGFGYSGEFIQAGGVPAGAKLRFVEGKYGGAVDFGEGTTAIRIPLDMHPEVYPQVTVTLWAYAQPGSGEGYLVSNGGYAGPILLHSGPEIQAHSVRSIARQRNVFRPGRWMFVAGVWDHEAGTMRLHLGRRVVEAEYSAEAALAANTAQADIWLGAYDDRLGRPAKGMRIDDVRIYGRALSEEEIEGLAIGQAPTPDRTAISSNQTLQPGQPQYGDITSTEQQLTPGQVQYQPGQPQYGDITSTEQQLTPGQVQYDGQRLPGDQYELQQLPGDQSDSPVAIDPRCDDSNPEALNTHCFDTGGAQLPGDQYDPQQLPGDQYDLQQLPGDQYDSQQLPGDQYDPQQLPGDQYDLQQLPGDQYDPQQLPGDQYDMNSIQEGQYMEEEEEELQM